MGEIENAHKVLVGKPEDDLRVFGRIIMKLILKKKNRTEGVWTVLMWLMTVTGGGVLQT
jgi:hypothetical protein